MLSIGSIACANNGSYSKGPASGRRPFPVVPTALQTIPSRALIEARLKRYVIEDRQKGCPKYTGVYHKLIVEYVLRMIEEADKKCVACGPALLLQGYSKCRGQVFSIDC